MATEAQVEVYLALQAHKCDLEITRGVSALDQEVLDRRIEDVQRLLEWLEQALEIEPRASPAVQTSPCPHPILQRLLAGGSAILATR